jgi:hypothetical protein
VGAADVIVSSSSCRTFFGVSYPMNCISQTENVAIAVSFRDNLVDVPLRHIKNLNLNAIITNTLPHTFHALLVRRLDGEVSETRLGQHNKHPLIPRLHHAHNNTPSPGRVVNLRLKSPMQHTLLVLHVLAQIHASVHINRQSLPRLLLQRDRKLSDDLTATTIASKQVLAADLVFVTRQRILDGRSDRSIRAIASKFNKRRIKPHSPPSIPCPIDQNRLQNRLRAIDMLAGTRSCILALAIRLAAPGVDSRPLIAGHVVAPARVGHVDLVSAFFEDGFFEADVSQAFLRRWVGDVGAWFFCCACRGRYDDSC